MTLRIRIFALLAAFSSLACANAAAQTARRGQLPKSVSASTLSPNAPPRLRPNRIRLANGKSFDLDLPEGYAISIAAQGLKRVRFMSQSPDGRVFVTDMYNLADNRRGAVYILEGFDPTRKSFAKVTPYLTGLRNPNSVAFYTEPLGTTWLYLALTDRLVRYRYRAGDNAPTGEPQVLATFPDYGLDYKYGGWHLTRTIAVGGNGKIYVSVGSSCNACEEKEEVRATIIEMDPDGKAQRYFARGLRNAVGLRWVNNRLYATDMGADHLGPDRPADTMYAVEAGTNYGWPYCYQSGQKILADEKYNPRGAKFNCRRVPTAYAAFDAHGSPLGLEYFDAAYGAELGGSFLVALHGPTKKGPPHGHRVARVRGGGSGPAVIEDFIGGFKRAGKINGRPCDLLKFDREGFLMTDDYAGVVYYVYKK